MILAREDDQHVIEDHPILTDFAPDTGILVRPLAVSPLDRLPSHAFLGTSKVCGAGDTLLPTWSTDHSNLALRLGY